MNIVTLTVYPTATDAGIIFFPPIKAPRAGCFGCGDVNMCRRVVANGGYALCEQVLEMELLPDAFAEVVLFRDLEEDAMDGTIWECYGTTKDGTALVLARDRLDAQALCRHWLGWTQTVAFRASEEMPTFVKAKGRPERPVVFTDGQHAWRVVEERRAETVEMVKAV